MLARNTTWTLSRDMALDLRFAAVTFYDGQGFLVPKSLNARRAADLNGATVCVLGGTTTHFALVDFARAKGLALRPAVFNDWDEAKAAFFTGNRCKAFTSNASQLASVRASDAPRPETYDILPDIISKNPLGPVVRRGDEEIGRAHV